MFFLFKANLSFFRDDETFDSMDEFWLVFLTKWTLPLTEFYVMWLYDMIGYEFVLCLQYLFPCGVIYLFLVIIIRLIKCPKHQT